MKRLDWESEVEETFDGNWKTTGAEVKLYLAGVLVFHYEHPEPYYAVNDSEYEAELTEIAIRAWLKELGRA